ncbi:MAG: type II toxin-antitoxin system RelE/ParE family toxin [Terriglobia bacterium]
MAYLANLTSRAERDLSQLFDDINARNSEAAMHWYRGLKEAILTLNQQPKGCAVTPENRKLRHLLYGNKPHVYRAIFRVLEKQKRVDVLHVRHGARRVFRRLLKNPASMSF